MVADPPVVHHVRWDRRKRMDCTSWPLQVKVLFAVLQSIVRGPKF